MSGFVCVSRTDVFTSAKLFFLQRAICEIVRKPAFNGLPRTSLGQTISFPASLSTFIFHLFSGDA
jgi:hypothetical protein